MGHPGTGQVDNFQELRACLNIFYHLKIIYLLAVGGLKFTGCGSLIEIADFGMGGYTYIS
jgi:hypothetical protein